MYNTWKNIYFISFLICKIGQSLTLFIYLNIYHLACFWAVPEKKNKEAGLRTYFFEKTPGFCRFFTLPLEIPDRTRLHPCKLHKIVLHPSEILRPKMKAPGNSTWLFLDHSQKFLVVFNQPPENPLPTISLSWKFYILRRNSPFHFWL